jgi:hypothetical protein
MSLHADRLRIVHLRHRMQQGEPILRRRR